MIGRPAAADLLDEARQTFLEVLLPLLPPESRYAGLMVANAMAIAARDARLGHQLMREGASGLASLLAASDVLGSLAPSELRPLLMEMERRLAREIRRGDYDGAGQRRDAVRRHLRESVERRVRLSNPKALSG